MLRKLLLLLLIGFSFIEVNAQWDDRIVSIETGCGDYTYEFELNGTVNGKDAFIVIQSTPEMSAWALDPPYNAVSASVDIRIEYNGVDAWEYYQVGTPNILVFNQTTDISGTKAPNFGWIVQVGCPGLMRLVAFDPSVLPVEKNELSKISLYPNPSTGYINISNLKENSRVVISNIAGQIVKDVVVGINDNRIDIQDLSQGFYFVELEGMKTIKLIKR